MELSSSSKNSTCVLTLSPAPRAAQPVNPSPAGGGFLHPDCPQSQGLPQLPPHAAWPGSAQQMAKRPGCTSPWDPLASPATSHWLRRGAPWLPLPGSPTQQPAFWKVRMACLAARVTGPSHLGQRGVVDQALDLYVKAWVRPPRLHEAAPCRWKPALRCCCKN